jgi:hypothetical protein
VYTDTDKLKVEMNRIAPEDTEVIREFTDTIREISKAELPIGKAPELYNVIDIAKLMVKSSSFIKFVGKYGKITTGEYAKRFKSPVFNKHFGQMFGLDSEFPMAALMSMIAWMYA